MPHVIAQHHAMQRREPELRIDFATETALNDIRLLRQVDGDGYLLDLPDHKTWDATACAECNLTFLRQTRPPGTTMSRAMATVRFREEMLGGCPLGIFDQAVVRYARRNLHLAALTAAPMFARRVVTDCRPLTAVTAVTAADNWPIIALLTRLGTVRIRPEIAADIHPVLGMRQNHIAEIAERQFGPGNMPIHWGFTGEALRHLLMLSHEATSERGHAVATATGTMVARVEGALDDPRGRDLIYRMATNSTALPVEITEFD